RGVEHPARPAGPEFEKLRPRETDEQDRGVPDPRREVLDQVEERRLAPVDVVEDEDDRPAARERLEEKPRRGEGILDAPAGILDADEGGDVCGCRLVVEYVRELAPGLLGGVVVPDAHGLADGLGKWPERDALSVWQAAAARHERRLAEVGEELPD